MVESQPSKLLVASSILVSRSILPTAADYYGVLRSMAARKMLLILV